MSVAAVSVISTLIQMVLQTVKMLAPPISTKQPQEYVAVAYLTLIRMEMVHSIAWIIAPAMQTKRQQRERADVVSKIVTMTATESLTAKTLAHCLATVMVMEHRTAKTSVHMIEQSLFPNFVGVVYPTQTAM